MSEVAVQDDPASAASEQAEALVSAASRLEEVCRDLTTCLRALPSLTERRAAALCLRAAAVSGRLHLKEAIRFLDAAWADDRDGPLCPERRVVPETPERSPPAGRTDGDGAPADGDASVTGMNGDEAQNGIMNGSAGGGDERESDASPEVGQVRAKKKPLNSDSDDPTGTPVRFNKKKRRDDPSQETVSSMSDDGASPVKVEPAASLADMKTEQSDSVCDVKMEPSDEFEMKTEPGGPVAEVKAEPSDGSELGLVIAAVEPLSQMSGSEPVAAKTEPDATASDKSESAAGAAEDSRPVSPLRDDSPVDESTSVDANPESQNDNDRLKLLLTSSDDEDADDPAADGAGVPNGGVDGDDMEDSASTVIRNGNERQRGADSPSSDEDSRGGRKLRKRTAKEKPPNSDSDATDPGDKNSHGRQRRTLKKSAGSDSERDDSERRSRRRRVGPKPEVSGSSADSVSVSDSAEEQRTERRRDRKGRRRPRGPPEPTADCSVSLTRLPPEMEREAADNGFVKITKRAKKQLSKQALEVRRLANVASLLRTSLIKGESSSEDSDDSDTEEDEKARKVKKSAARSTEKSAKKKRKTLNDMSDGDSGGRTSGVESDEPNQPSAAALVPLEENEFDRQQLLASDSGSDADSESAGDGDDSDFLPSGKDKRKGKKKRKEEENKETNNDSECEDGSDSKNDTKKGKDKRKKGSESENSCDSDSKKNKRSKEKKDVKEDSEDEEGDKVKRKDKKKAKKEQKDNEATNGEGKEDNDEDKKAKSDGDASGSEAETDKKGKKKLSSKVRQLLNGKMSATDSSEEDEKMKKKIMEKRSKELEKAAKKKADSDDPDADGDGSQSDGLPPVVDVPSSEEEVVEKKRSPRKKRLRIAEDSDSDFCILDSEGSAGSDAEEAGPSKKRGRSSSSSISSVSDSADDFQPPKKTRSRGRLKRIRRLSDDSQSSSGDDSVQEEKPESQGTPGKGGRKNIRHIREAEQSTKEASQAELERRKRIEDKQAMYNELFKKSAASEESTALDKLVLDFDPETKKPLVSVHKNFVKILKPHQVDGVKFMFDSTIESVARLEDETNQDNAGCILAHCMGLGKTLQVVVLLHTLLDSAATSDKVSCALVVCPKNTVQNWVRELKSWQKKCRVPEVDVVDITFRKDNYERSFELEQWRTEGGVCVLSYDMFKRFSGTGGKKGYVKKQKDRFQSALIDPGPDIVVCDEGHLLKNPRTAAFKSLNQMKCRRRVILTGTPLQNNLREYHTMVEFVKPRLLGSESEFSNRFIRPIENGSAVDALPRDVKLMKRRSHVLHKLLNSVVQRRDYNVLMPFLPPKLEFTLMVKLSDLQKKLYQNYLEKARSSSTRKVLSDFQALSRVWTHPRSIQMKDEQDDEKEEMRTEREAMERFVANDSSSEEENSKDGADKTEENGGGAAEQADDSEWWRSCIPDDLLFEDAGLSGKLTLLDQLLIKCENIGDKLLVFSQSLFTLNLIEEHLERLHKDMQSSRNSGKKHPSHVYFGTWKPDYDYFRLDGSTSEERRQLMCDRINKATNERARLMLISTKAGGLGINLVGANRVVIFDASWNPTADSQAIFRVYRFGQVKPSYVYRFIAQGCMEEKIYDRQISKLSLSCRVVDEQQVERHFSQHDVEELYEFEPDRKRTTGLIVPKDDLVLMELVSEQTQWVSSVHGHDSLLQNVADEELNADEQRAAWEEYENDRRGIPNVGDIIPLVDGKAIDKATVIEMIKKDNPTATENEVLLMIPKAIQTLRAYYFKKQQAEQRAREEQYRQTLELQRQSMFSQHALHGGHQRPNIDHAAYAQLLKLMAAQRAPGQAPGAVRGAAPPPARGRPPAAAAAGSAGPGRQRTAHVPGPAHQQQLAAALQRSMGTGSMQLPQGLSVQRVPPAPTPAAPSSRPEKRGQDGDKPTGPPAVVDIT